MAEIKLVTWFDDIAQKHVTVAHIWDKMLDGYHTDDILELSMSAAFLEVMVEYNSRMETEWAPLNIEIVETSDFNLENM